MNAWRELAPFLALGLLGSLHCAGMCGGFALAVAGAPGGPWKPLLSGQFVYLLGKALTYAVIGATMAAGVAWLSGGELGAGHLAFAGRATGVLAGIFLIGMGLAQWGVRLPAPLRGTRIGRRLIARLRSAFARVGALPGQSGNFGVGVLNGLLPCGLSWGAFALAAPLPVPTAALGCFLFGLTTAPPLLAVAIAPRWISSLTQRRTGWLVGGALVAFGGLALGRALRPASAANSPNCCAEGRTAQVRSMPHAQFFLPLRKDLP